MPDAGTEPAGTVGPGVQSGAVDGGTEGTVFFRVRALQSDGQVSDWSTAQAVVDRTPPTLDGATPSGTISADGWYRSPLTFTFSTCADAGGIHGALHGAVDRRAGLVRRRVALAPVA